MTQNERTAQIDRQFDISFGVFDGQIRDEQAVIAGQRGGRGSGAGGGREGTGIENGEGAGGDSVDGNGSGSGQNGNGGSGTGQNGNGNGSGEGQGERGEGRGQGGGGGYGGGAGGGSGPNTVPADIPDGKDDDVVARQLREAAMSETDPELREKLWQEYRNYRKSAG